MIFQINDVHYIQESASLDSVINFVSYYFEDSGSRTGGGINTVRKHYSLQLNTVPSSEFIGYNSVTTSSLKDWIETSHGNTWGSFTSSIDTAISTSLSADVNSSTPLHSITWNSGSMARDTNLTQVFFALGEGWSG